MSIDDPTSAREGVVGHYIDRCIRQYDTIATGSLTGLKSWYCKCNSVTHSVTRLEGCSLLEKAHEHHGIVFWWKIAL